MLLHVIKNKEVHEKPIMLCCNIRSCVLMFVFVLLLLLCRVSNGTKPTISPSQKELVINEGGPLEIVCTGNIPIQFTFPYNTKKRNTSEVKTNIYEKDGIYTYILQRAATVFGDTGWYGCANKDVRIDSDDDHDDPEVNWLYIYVKSDKNFFVEYTPSDLNWICASKAVFKTVVIPCRPTSPDLEVKFETENEGLKNKTSFDPKIGFTIMDVEITDTGEISCIIEEGNYKQVMNYMLDAESSAKDDPIDADIYMTPIPPLTRRGQDLRMNCTIEIYKTMSFNLSWTKLPDMPDINVQQDNIRGSIQLFRETIDANMVLITSQLTILNITDEDMGYYICENENICTFKYRMALLEMPDSREVFINLSLHPSERYYQREKNHNVEWVVHCEGYPEPTIHWFKPNGLEIRNSDSPKYNLTIIPGTYFTIIALQIKSLQIQDMGIYTVEARNNYTFANINITLDVLEPPYFNMTNMNKTVPRNIEVTPDNPKTEVLKCIADGLPKPEITWYKDDELIKESTWYKFTNNDQELNINFISQIQSGIYSCRAKNRLGTKKTFQEIKVYDKWNKYEKILIISIAILVIVLLILTAFSIMKVRREKKIRKKLMEASLTNFEKGALECLNPDLTVDDQAELLPYDNKWEFPRERLKLGKKLGSGMFGVVMKAEAQRIYSGELVTTVAVKMARRTTDPTYVRALANELKIMVHLGKHLNIVNLLGAYTKNISKRELLVIVEYCRFGNLHNYLLKHRTDFINQIDPNSGKLDITIGLDTATRTVNINSNNRINRMRRYPFLAVLIRIRT